jgi:hypothetical protein
MAEQAKLALLAPALSVMSTSRPVSPSRAASSNLSAARQSPIQGWVTIPFPGSHCSVVHFATAWQTRLPLHWFGRKGSQGTAIEALISSAMVLGASQISMHRPTVWHSSTPSLQLHCSVTKDLSQIFPVVQSLSSRHVPSVRPVARG